MSPRALQISPEVRLPQVAGGKAHGLQLIARAGLPSPPAWVVTPGATEADIDACKEELLKGGRVSFAVRSSAEDEDCGDTSFAGIHESHLGVHVEDLSMRVTEVAASAVSTRARSYRRELGLPPLSGPCSVIVHEMVAADHSGVAFGVGEDNDAVLIEAVEGLGDTAVDGRVTPETHLVRRSGGDWRTTRRTPRSQSVVTTASGDGVARVTLSETRHGDVLDDRCAAEIADGVIRLQRLAGRRLDVEWTCAGGTVWFVQARPQTRPLAEELPAGQVWTRINVREVLPDIPSAFSRATLTPILDAAEREFLRTHGVCIEESRRRRGRERALLLFVLKVVKKPEARHVGGERLQGCCASGLAWRLHPPSPRTRRNGSQSGA
jgi:pyruvate,water dikinase